MYGSNPFAAQDGWNAGNGQSTWNTSVPPPSIFGALPYPSVPSILPGAITLKFTSLSPTILNCKVIGPRNETYFRVVTDGGHTVLKDAQGSNIALLEWRDRPTVEARSLVAKQPMGQWLRLSTDRSHRFMVHNGVGYSWRPHDRFLQLSIPGSYDVLARVSKTYDVVILEMTPYAIQLGLLELGVLATILLQCGKSID
ncbi:uncharacterized protein BJ212DRAFT_1262867 [Suillus subaureus]|uniref:DUF6593 domain-containing protein n=1 Tax=Suillus subaureus TaxID=48587 RepID=A0A9P7JI22_9AGAM|nr:uncharacterized protein BJ212DRAFT_1262867 [Suillus subaureus]KAG1823426.1 hypothetical protein BJ212DRAFT_1262867 [Suillus subaureus]